MLVLTDGSGYALGEGDVAVAVPDAPVWMVHLGGFPLGYDDPTLDAIQASGGGAAASVDEALARLAVGLTGQVDDVTADVIDGYQWLTLPTEMADTLSSVGPSTPSDAEAFAPFAARRLILAEMRRERGQIAELDVLDRLHALASNYGIVTPLSSMIVLSTSSSSGCWTSWRARTIASSASTRMSARRWLHRPWRPCRSRRSGC